MGGDLEQALDGSGADQAADVARAAGFEASLLAAAFLVRRDVGRLNDLIHAAAISLTLPLILEPGERLTNRPSLAAGNDPTRLFDVETDRRVAEFKLAVWAGTDAMRKRGSSTTWCTWPSTRLAADPSCTSPATYRCGSCDAPVPRLDGH